MTKIGQLYEEEKIEAVNEAVQKSKSEIAKNLLDNGADIALVMKSTGLTRAEINRLWELSRGRFFRHRVSCGKKIFPPIANTMKTGKGTVI